MLGKINDYGVDDELRGITAEQASSAELHGLDFLKKVVRFPGVRINRDEFLRQELTKLRASEEVIERALDGGYEPVSFLAEDTLLEREALPLAARCPGVPVYTASADILRNLTGFPMTRGILCAMHRKPLPTLEQVCATAFRVAVLEHVVNPTNVGAIFRSAAALSMDAVLLTKDCSNPLYRRAARVSMGTVFQIPWTYVDAESDWPGPAMENLRQLGFRTAAMALRKDTVSIDDPRLSQEEKLAVILGTEGDGLLEETIDACDYTIKIPMSHGVDSLNVAAASAVAFWELKKP